MACGVSHSAAAPACVGKQQTVQASTAASNSTDVQSRLTHTSDEQVVHFGERIIAERHTNLVKTEHKCRNLIFFLALAGPVSAHEI